MNKIALIGDSIFDNAGYVGSGESVSEQLQGLLGSEGKVLLLAVDGNVTTDVPAQLTRFEKDVTHAFVSCGGNDALRIASVLNEESKSVGESMELFSKLRSEFRANYRMMLHAILGKCERLTVCTIYNSVPDVGERALAALALFNEIILQEAIENKLPIIDLRVICQDIADYSAVSPIEPSGQGASKIVKVIQHVANTHEYGSKVSHVYV